MLWPIALIGLLGIAGCRDDAAVMEVHPIENGLALEVILDTCNADVSVEVDEYHDRIVIHPTNHDRRSFFSGGDDCLDMVRVELESPLGNRNVTDSSGEEVTVIQP